MYEFTEEDLKYNQRGQLSPAQGEWLKSIGRGGVRIQRSNVWIAVVFMLVGLCLILGMYVSNEDSQAALFASPLNLLIFPVIVFVILGILILSILLAKWNSSKLGTALLSSVSGKIHFDQDSSGESAITTYYVIVGRKKFKFADDMSRKFGEGQKYKFYYCKAGMYEFVMSYERVAAE